MASLTGQTVSSTYDGLLKTDDNDILGAAPKEITDGLGNGSGMTLSTTGDVSIAGDLTVDGAILDSNGVPGASGQILSSTVTGTDWVDLSEISGVDGSGTANYIAKWTDGDSIGNSVIYDNGTNVGIGTASPAAKLDVEGLMLNGSTNPSIMDGGNLRKKIEWNGALNSFGVYNTTNAGADWQTNLLVTNTGDVLVGLTSRVTGLEAVTQFEVSGNQGGITINSNQTTADKYSRIMFTKNQTTGNEGLIRYNVNDYHMAFWTNANERMRIDSTGNVGIGTSSPATKLDVNGVINVRTNGYEFGRITTNNVSGTDGGLTFQTISGGVFSESMRIDYLGKVGIGTASPTAKLDLVDNSVQLRLANSTTGTTASDGSRIYLSGNDLFIVNRESANIQLYTTDTERMRIDSSGRVGIGIETYTSSGLLNLKGSGLALKNDLNGGSSNWSLIQNQATADSASIDFISGQGLAMTIAHNKNVGIGSTDPARKLELKGDRDAIIRLENTRTVESAGQILGAIEFYGNDSSGQGAGVKSSIVARTFGGGEASYLTFSTTSTVNDVEKMRLESDGDLHVDGDVIAYSTTISDQRLKDNVQTIDNALDKVSSLRGVSYTWNNGNRKGQKDLGLIAQEVEQVLPELVREKEMPMIDGGTYKTVDYEKIVGVLIEAVKELKQEIEILKAK